MASLPTVKCSRCPIRAPQDLFPKNIRSRDGYLKTCQACTKKQEDARIQSRTKKAALADVQQENIPPTPDIRPGNKDRQIKTHASIPTLTYDEFLHLLEEHKSTAFELDAFVQINDDTRLLGEKGIADRVAGDVRQLTRYRMNSKGKRPTAEVPTYIYYCAQRDGEQTKNALHPDPKKQRSRAKMERFNCHGDLQVKIPNTLRETISIRLTHHLPHTPYTDISISETIKQVIRDMADMPPNKIWDHVLTHYPEDAKNLTEQQIYFAWLTTNEQRWRSDDDQVKSALALLKKLDGIEIENIAVTQEPGIHSLAFAFKDVLDVYGAEIVELAMDSTWKTNALGYELYALVGEADGQALPLAFAFTATLDDSVKEGAKERLLRTTLQHVVSKCPNIQFTLCDKDPSELKAYRAEIPDSKQQTCTWHATEYVGKRLSEDKPPQHYDPRDAHKVLNFIDPTWAPGVTSELNDETNLVEGTKTCRAPLMILKANGHRIPVWPSPPTVKERVLDDEFCPKQYRTPVNEMFRMHMHRHPDIPIDAEGTYQTAEEIYDASTRELYEFCFSRGLAQLWAYFWNRWYNPQRWKEWTRASYPEVPHLKTTMIVESLWKHLKHKHLSMFNRPRLDLVTHVIITDVLPRVKEKLDTLLGNRRVGRPKALAEWRKDLKAEWQELSKSDEQRLTEQELTWRKKSLKTPGRAEKLVEIETRRKRGPGKYYTDVDKWVCTCRSFSPSRFLICKHLVREANKRLRNLPLDKQQNMEFFCHLRRNRTVPFYTFPTRSSEEAPSQIQPELTEVVVIAGATERRVKHVPTAAPVKSGVTRVLMDPVDHGASGNKEGKGVAVGRGENFGAYDVDDNSDNEERIFPTEARRQDLKRRFGIIMQEFDSATGIHPKMLKELEKAVQPMEKMAGELDDMHRKRKRSRTYKDSTPRTMFAN